MNRTQSAAVVCGMVAVAIVVGSFGPWMPGASGSTGDGMDDLGPLALGLGLTLLALAVTAVVEPRLGELSGWCSIPLLLGTGAIGFARSVSADMTPAPLLSGDGPGWGLRLVFYVSGPALVTAAQLIRWGRRDYPAPDESDADPATDPDPVS
jgi:hypothetical protein